jgi:hypothetical protein
MYPYGNWFKARFFVGLVIIGVMLIIEGVRHLMGLPPIGDHPPVSHGSP